MKTPNKYTLIEVINKESEDLFLYGINHIYEGDNNWVANLDMDVKNIFNPDKNQLLQKGEAKKWIVLSDDKVVLGRIAAFFNEEKSKKNEQLTGGIGFYECIDDKKISTLLFDTAIDWLKEKGLEAVDGPVNFGDNYNNWGLLVENRIQQMYGMQYHPAYYKEQFEDYGFKLYFKQYSFRIEADNVSERIFKIGEWVNAKGKYKARHLKYSQLDSFSTDMTIAFNNIWSAFKDDYTPIKKADIKNMLKESKPLLDPKLIWLIYKDDTPVAVSVMIPDANQLIKKINGKINLFNTLKLLYYKYTGTINRVRSMVIGVCPEHQKSGVEALIFYKTREVFDKSKYNELDFSWIGDYNPKMLSVIDAIGAEKSSTHHTYRYLFDRDKEFERHPMVE